MSDCRKDNFIRALFHSTWENMGCDIDGQELQDLGVKYGVLVSRSAAQEEYDNEDWWGHDWDMEAGSVLFELHPSLRQPLSEPRGPSMTEQTPAMHALLQYQQADMDGITVTTSRQAIHEVEDEYKVLQAENELLRGERDRQYDYNVEKIAEYAALQAENERLREVLKNTLDYIPGEAHDRAIAALNPKESKTQ